MALYPTPAGQRMQYDRDGSAVFYFQTGGGVTTVTQMTAAQSRKLNGELIADMLIGTGAGPYFQSFSPTYLGIIFPNLRDIAGYFFSYIGHPGNISSGNFQTSTNSTTGADGTWTTAEAMASVTPIAQDSYRSSIHAVSVAGVKAIRWQCNFPNDLSQCQVHVYGTHSAGSNPDSLRIWQPVTNAELTTVLDWGDIPRGTTTTMTFRVKNLSATKKAWGITVSEEILTDAAPSLASQFQFSTDNVNFFSSISIGDLAPGAISPVLYVRDSVASGAQLAVWALRMVATPTSFS